MDIDVIKAHRHCRDNRNVLLISDHCGCFYCEQIYKLELIHEWCSKDTAVCPNCGIDSVIGSASGYKIDAQFLNLMYEHWFAIEVPS